MSGELTRVMVRLPAVFAIVVIPAVPFAFALGAHSEIHLLRCSRDIEWHAEPVGTIHVGDVGSTEHGLGLMPGRPPVETSVYGLADRSCLVILRVLDP